MLGTTAVLLLLAVILKVSTGPLPEEMSVRGTAVAPEFSCTVTELIEPSVGRTFLGLMLIVRV